MFSILKRKYVFSVFVALSFIIIGVVFLEPEITDISEIFQQSTLISMSIYFLGIVVAVEFFQRLFIKRVEEKGFVYGLAVFFGLPLGFLLALSLQLIAIRLFFH